MELPLGDILETAGADEARSVATELLRLRLAEVGELDPSGFRAWEVSLDDRLARIDDVLRSGRVYECWFSLTEFGREIVDAGLTAADARTFDARHPAVAPLRAASRLLAAEDDEFIADWRPEEPPLVLRLATLGRVVVRTPALPPAERAAVLAAVEEALSEGDERWKDAMATGFLEAIVVDANGVPEPVWQQLGPESRGYVRAWREGPTSSG